MSEFQHKRPELKEKPAVPAVIKARDMLCDLSGPRGWNDTRESWLARGARRAGLSLRRARAVFYQEPIRLTADEYFEIEAAWARANDALASLSHMASDPGLRAGGVALPGGAARLSEGEPSDGEARRAAPAPPPAGR